MNKIKFLNLDYLFLIIVINSTAFTFYSGFRGVYPIDSFIIFNSGYKVLNGIHPFKDYWTVTGPLLDYLQSVFFYLIGISWFSYVIHAVTINCLVSISLFYFLLKIGVEKKYSFIYTLSAAILAYPSAGTPFVDHHAVLLSFTSLLYFLLGIKSNKKLYWILSGLFLVASFFSKQVPSTYIGVFFTAVTITMFFLKNENKNYLYFIYSGIGGLFFCLSFFLINGIPIENFITQYIFYPLTIGEARIENFSHDFKNTILQYKFIYLSILPAIAIYLDKMTKKMFLKNKDEFIFFIVFVVSVLIFIYNQTITKNQILIFFLIPFCLGVSHYFIIKKNNKKIFINFLLIILVVTTFKYHIRYNENKKFMELENINLDRALDAKLLDEKLSGLKWITKKYKNNPQFEIKNLIEIKNLMEKDQSNKILISDYQVLPALLNNKNYAPNKWFDPISIPDKKNKYFITYQIFFISSLKNQKINMIYVVENDKLEIFLPIFKDQNCYKKTKINEMGTKLNITDCLN